MSVLPNMTAGLSATWGGNMYPASNLINGNLATGNFASTTQLPSNSNFTDSGTGVSTSTQVQFALVDLGVDVPISQVIVRNRKDAAQTRIAGTELQVLNNQNIMQYKWRFLSDLSWVRDFVFNSLTFGKPDLGPLYTGSWGFPGISSRLIRYVRIERVKSSPLGNNAIPALGLLFNFFWLNGENTDAINMAGARYVVGPNAGTGTLQLTQPGGRGSIYYSVASPNIPGAFVEIDMINARTFYGARFYTMNGGYEMLGTRIVFMDANRNVVDSVTPYVGLVNDVNSYWERTWYLQLQNISKSIPSSGLSARYITVRRISNNQSGNIINLRQIQVFDIQGRQYMPSSLLGTAGIGTNSGTLVSIPMTAISSGSVSGGENQRIFNGILNNTSAFVSTQLPNNSVFVNSSTGNVGTGRVDQFITIDLGADRPIGKIAVWNRNGRYDWSQLNRIVGTQLQIQKSDGQLVWTNGTEFNTVYSEYIYSS